MNTRKPQQLAAIVVLIFTTFGDRFSHAQERPAESIPLFKIEKSAASLAFAPDGKRLACDLSLYDLNGKEVAKGEFDEKLPRCMYVAFSPDGKQLASVHFDDSLILSRHAICLWCITADKKLLQGTILKLTKDQHPLYRESMYYLTFSSDGRKLASREPDDATVVWDTMSGKELFRLESHGLAVAFAPDGRTLTTVTRDGLVQHWDLVTKKCVDPQDSAKREDYLFVENAIASADGKTLAITDGYSVLLKDTHSGKTLRRFDNLATGLLALSSDGKTLAASCSAGVVLFDRETGKELVQLRPAANKWVKALAFSPDAKSLAVGMGNSNYERREYVTVWEIAKLPPVRKNVVERESPSIPLEVKLTSRKDFYPLILNRKTPEEFARQFRGGSLPPSPKVDLVLTLRNTGTKDLTINPDILNYLYLIGDGAVNHPEAIYQTEGSGKEPKQVTIAPGKTYTIPIQSLDRGFSRQSYWLLPGEYTLHASVCIWLTPAPESADKLSDGSGFVTIKAPPLQVKVVTEKK